MTRRSRLATRPRLESLEVRMVLSALTPAQLDSAYGLNGVNFKANGTTIKGDGTGQTIAIIDVDHDPNLAGELATFDGRYGLPAAQLSVSNLAGSTTDPGWSTEEALDVEWAHAAALGAKILVVEAQSTSVTDLLAAVNVAKATPGVSVVSMSWGTSEFSAQTSYDSIFTTPAGHTGITFLASTGDSGPGAEWPASSPNVVAVGGTSLNTSAAGTRLGESAWAGTGGGLSRYEATPSFQAAVNTTGRRDAVDVALNADPNTGVSVYSVAGGGWLQVGGTSLSAPVWAGLIAIADEGRALSGKGPLDGATQTLADLYAAPSGSFNDITTGSRAAPGYDSSTGLGTPNATTLVAALVADPNVGAANPILISTPTPILTPTPTPIPTKTPPSGTTTPIKTAPTSPPSRHPFGRWRGFGHLTSTPLDSSSAPSAPKNAGPVATKGSTPHTPVRAGNGWAVNIPLTSNANSATHRSVEVVLKSWGQSALN